MGGMTWTGIILDALVVTVVAFVLDGILWSFVFNKGMEHLMHMSKDEAGKAMGRLMGQSGAAQLIFGLFFTVLWATVGHAMPARGIVGGLEFGLLVWLPTVGYSTLANTVWYGKSRPLASATAWTALIKYLVVGAVLSFMI